MKKIVVLIGIFFFNFGFSQYTQIDYNDFTNFPTGFSQSGFSNQGFGVEVGGSSDKCAYDKIPATNGYVSIQATLSSGYNYRFSFRAKRAKTATCGLTLKYASTVGSGGTSVSSEFTPPKQNGSGTGTEYVSNIIVGDGNTYYLKIVTTTGNSSQVKVRIDGYKLEREPIASTPTITATSSSLTGFTYVEGSGPSAEQSFNVAGSNLTNDITVTPPTNWEIATTSGGPYQTSAITLTQSGGTVASTPIYTRMISGLTNANSPFSGNIACTSTDATTVNVAVDGTVTVACTEPTADGSFHLNSPQNVTGTSLTLNWNNGDGANRIVVMKETSAVTSNPVDLTTYTANTVFGSGSDIGTNEFVVYNGSGSTVAITGLTPGTLYYAKIFEYGCNPGSENYYTSGTPATDNFITTPKNPINFTSGCIGQTSIDLSWSAPASGNFDGYLLVVREGATPHSVNSLDPTTALGENLDYSLATTFGSTSPNSRILYKGSATNATITGLTTGTNYTFKVFTYKTGTGSYKYSSGTSIAKTINLFNVNNASTATGNTQLDVSWTNPNASCFDEILVVVNDASGITFTPSGDGSTYTANSVYASNNQIVYKGTGTAITVTGLTNGTTYYFEIFVRNGTEWSSGIEISGIPNISTVLGKGDLAILAVNTQYGSNGRDELSFVSFVDITPNTKIYLTDNGYQRRYANEWGGTEGVLSIVRTGTTLAKGTVITIKTTGNVTTESQFDVYTCGNIDNNWTKDALSGGGIGGFNLNNDDDVWIMQGGIWSNDTSHHSTYTGNVLYGWTESGWDTGVGTSSTGNTKWSAIYPDSKCFTTIAPVGDGKVKFNDPNDPDFSTTTNDQLDWIALISNTNNWDTYNDNATYNSGGYDYYGNSTCPIITIAAGTHFEGKWNGTNDNNWFDCNNWDNLKVPDENTDVTITGTAINQATIDATATDSDLYNDIAKTNDLTIENGLWIEILNANDKLEIHGNLSINSGASLDMDGTTTNDGTIDIYGNWNNLATESEFYEGQGSVNFIGSTTQTVTCNSGSETEKFYNLKIDNSNGVSFASNNIHAAGNLNLQNSPSITMTSGHYILAGKDLLTNTDITLEHGASLTQTDDSGINSGTGNTNYTIKKNTDQAIFSDVSYFASPTVGTTIDDMVPATTYHYSFSPSAQNWNYGIPGSTVMEAGRGYILRNPNIGNYTVTFNGEIHNGTINYPVLINGTGAAGDDDWNLLGNPYPSAIDADKFFTTNTTTIVGAIYYWKHGTVLNATQSDYINGGYTVYNAMGAAGGIGGTVGQDNGAQYIPSGQAFFVEAKTNTDVVFSNTDRAIGNNTTFYRVAENTNRIWLNLIDQENAAVSQQLIAFYNQASDAKDDQYDAHLLGSGMLFYSLLDDEKFTIRTNDENYEGEVIPLGYQAPHDGEYTITIDHTTGTIASHGNYIYLRDNETNNVHDLTAGDYAFTTVLGENNTRFELFATQTALTVDRVEHNTDDQLIVLQNQGQFNLSTLENKTISRLTVFDVIGRKLLVKDANAFTLDCEKGQVLIIQVTLENGMKLTKKVIKM